MSLVCLKKKSKRFINKISSNHISQSGLGFSINGPLRNQGWIGQDSRGRSLNRTPFRGNKPIGYGGCCGRYVIDIVNGGPCIVNDKSIIKRSTMNTSGHIHSTFIYPTSVFNSNCSCSKNFIWVKNMSPLDNDQSTYIDNLSKKNTCVILKPSPCIKKCNPNSDCKNVHNYSKFNLPTTSSDYIRTGLMVKNDLPTPPNKAPFPMVINHTGNCDVNFYTPQQAIDYGFLPPDWMNPNYDYNSDNNRKPCSKTPKAYVSTDTYNLIIPC